VARPVLELEAASVKTKPVKSIAEKDVPISERDRLFGETPEVYVKGLVAG